MTAPVQQQDQLQPIAPPPDTTAAEAAVLAALAAYLATAGTAAAAGAVLSPAALVAAMARLGISKTAARASLELAISIGRRTPPVPAGAGRAAQRASATVEPMRRAAYLLNAGRRLTRALTTPKPGAPEVPSKQRLLDALQLERRYLAQHVEAGKARRLAAVKVDAAAAVHGQLLGWRAVMDERTTAECRAADGKNFRVTAPPPWGLPGAVHPTCRCTAGAPHPGAPVLNPGGTT